MMGRDLRRKLNLKRFISFVVLISFFLQANILLRPSAVLAFAADTTYRELTEKAIELKRQEHIGDEKFQDFIKQAREKIIDGSEEEDYPEPA